MLVNSLAVLVAVSFFATTATAATATDKVPKPIHWLSPRGQHWTGTFHADHTIDGTSECSYGAGAEDCTDTGSWAYNGDKICFKWATWSGGCFPLSRFRF